MALMLLAIGVAAAPSAGEEAQAATRVPAASTKPLPGPDSLLGALSFTANRDPIDVSADAMEFDYRSRVLTYTGHVEVTQGDMKLESKRLTVALDEGPENRIKEVVADGQVRLSKGTRWATGKHAVFDQAQSTVVLSGDAQLHDGPNQVTGDRVVVYLDEKRSVVEGGKGRVTAKLFPSQGTGTPAGGRTP
jgi:lipopolysaccharide export system protein LptA